MIVRPTSITQGSKLQQLFLIIISLSKKELHSRPQIIGSLMRTSKDTVVGLQICLRCTLKPPFLLCSVLTSVSRKERHLQSAE